MHFSEIGMHYVSAGPAALGVNRHLHHLFISLSTQKNYSSRKVSRVERSRSSAKCQSKYYIYQYQDYKYLIQRVHALSVQNMGQRSSERLGSFTTFPVYKENLDPLQRLHSTTVPGHSDVLREPLLAIS
jgi:hypothetical protein